MSDPDARARLSACRWENENRHDPFFAEALDQAAREPALAARCEAQRALDEVFACRLRELVLPGALQNE